MKRILSALLAGALLMGCASIFTSCGSKKPVKVKADHVYRVTAISAGGENSWVNRLFTQNGKYYATIGETDPETYEYKTVTYEISAEDKSLTPAKLGGYQPEQNNAKENKYLMTSAYCESGASWHFFNSYTFDEKTQEYSEKNTILFADKNGKVVFEKEIKDVTGGEYNYVQYAVANGDDIIFTDGGNVYKVDTSGKLVKKVSLKSSEDSYLDISRMDCEGDTVKIITQDYSTNQSKATYVTVDMKSGKIDKSELPSDTFRNVWSYFLGPDYSFYLAAFQAE